MDNKFLKVLMDEIERIDRPINIMEVCGTHTMEIGKLGLRNLLGDKIRLISGPGCPVCVTPSYYIDYIYYLALDKKISIITYGDMLRVPGTNRDITLEKARARGADINIIYSAMDSIALARKNKDKSYLFVAIGFETTIPSTVILMEEIIKQKLNNLFILSLHKRVEPVMRALIMDKKMKIDGFLCPGNVAVVLGEEGFNFIKELGSVGVISGFTKEQIVTSLIYLLRNINNKGTLINNYKEFVSREGNPIVKKLINKYFYISQSRWRGLGIIEESGYSIKKEYEALDITRIYPEEEAKLLKNYNKDKNICRCGEILKGTITPKECPAFKKLCTPAYPVGPCMVSSEGTCAAYYKYEN